MMQNKSRSSRNHVSLNFGQHNKSISSSSISKRNRHKSEGSLGCTLDVSYKDMRLSESPHCGVFSPPVIGRNGK